MEYRSESAKICKVSLIRIRKLSFRGGEEVNLEINSAMATIFFYYSSFIFLRSNDFMRNTTG